MTEKEERVWAYLVENRKADNAEVAAACGVDVEFVKHLINRIGSDNWREETTSMGRAKILDTAKDYVTRDRAADHGSMEDNFQTVATYWNAHLGIDWIEPQDVAVMMTMLKLARIRQNEHHLDNWIDASGYMACGGEIMGKV